jgi:hypothetical protein
MNASLGNRVSHLIEVVIDVMHYDKNLWLGAHKILPLAQF